MLKTVYKAVNETTFFSHVSYPVFVHGLIAAINTRISSIETEG